MTANQLKAYYVYITGNEITEGVLDIPETDHERKLFAIGLYLGADENKLHPYTIFI